MKKRTIEEYTTARERAIANLEAIAGKDAVLPIDVAGSFLPTIPEWDEFKVRRARGTGRRTR